MQQARNRVQGTTRPAGSVKLQQSTTNERRVLSDITNAKPPSSFGTPRPSAKEQSATAERRVLSDISNAKPLSSFGTPKPSTTPGFAIKGDRPIKADYKVKSENLPQPSQKPPTGTGARIPLRTIINESQSAPSAREVGVAGVKQSQKAKKKAGPNKVLLTAEQLRQAEEWAKEDLDIERTHFTGEDMDALREKLIEAEIEDTVAMVRNYQGGWFQLLSKPKLEDLEPIYFEDGRLKPDVRSKSADEDLEYPLHMEALKVEAGVPLDEDLALELNNCPEDFAATYPPIPEDWHIVQETCPSVSM